jgi:hypothetical protein
MTYSKGIVCTLATEHGDHGNVARRLEEAASPSLAFRLRQPTSRLLFYRFLLSQSLWVYSLFLP